MYIVYRTVQGDREYGVLRSVFMYCVFLTNAVCAF